MSKKKNLVIDLQKVTRQFGKGDTSTVALNNVSLQIEEGEFVAIMGRSGSGKSTLMNIIGLLDSDYIGTYMMQGEKVSGFSENETADIRSQSIGFVFQQFNLLKRTTALDNVLLPTTFNPSSDDEVRAVKALKSVGLGDKLYSKSNQLSGGQIQRVAIARALVMNPAIILADEPTGNLDSKTGNGIHELFCELNTEQGTTMLIVTHNPAFAALLPKTYAMVDGRLVAQNAE